MKAALFDGTPGLRIVVGNYKSSTDVHLFHLARKEQSVLTSWLATMEAYEIAVDPPPCATTKLRFIVSSPSLPSS